MSMASRLSGCRRLNTPFTYHQNSDVADGATLTPSEKNMITSETDRPGLQEVIIMRENLTELVFILDRSGSMSGLESDTIGGFNSMIRKQKKEDGEAFVSTVLFDDSCDVIHDRVKISEVKELTDKDYFVRGCTALLDAVGGAINHIGNIQKYAREEDRPAKTLFVITTDGLENASRRYSFKDVKRMIERQKEKYNWEFLFLGANIDAIEVAGSMGIDRDRAANYNCDSDGTALNYMVLEEAVSRVRSCSPAKMSKMFAGGAWKASIDEDYAERSEKGRGKRRA